MYKENYRELFSGLFVAMIACIVYANSLNNGFTLDDDSVILNNPLLKGNILSLFGSIDTTGEAQLLPFYRPFTYLTFMIEWHLHGFNPFFVRLANVLLHSANAFLVYRLVRTLNKDSIYVAVLAGIIFAVHPLHSEGVDFNAGGRNTMLACFFSISVFLLHCKSIDRSKMTWAFAGAFLFLAGLFSKETALMILPFILALEINLLRQNIPGTRMQAYLRLTPYMAATVLYLLMRWLTLSKLGIQSSVLPGIGSKVFESMYITTDLSTRLLNNVYIIPRYLLTVIWPTALANRYVMPDDLHLLALPLFSAWLFILGVMGWLFTKGRSTLSLFGFSWLILFWLPVSGIVLVPGAPLADRFLYIPAIGLWIVVSDQIFRFFPTNKTTIRTSGITIAALTLLLLATVTIKRNLDWKSNLTLHTRFVAQYPDNVHARAGLGKVYYGIGKERDLAAAENEFDMVIAMDPNFPMIHTYLGNINLNQEKLEDALHHYSKAIENFPNDKEARVNRGITLEKLGRPKEAFTDYLFFLTSPGSFDKLPGGREHAEKRLRELAQ